jgi:hypothetical protein
MEITFEFLVGKTILVGITYMNNDEVVIEQKQFHGTVITADEYKGILIKKTSVEKFNEPQYVKGKLYAEDKEQFWLPADLSAFCIAEPGEYRLRSTGEIVENPDLISTWIFTKPQEKG